MWRRAGHDTQGGIEGISLAEVPDPEATPGHVLRRATASVQRAQDSQHSLTDEDIQRAAGWVLGRT